MYNHIVDRNLVEWGSFGKYGNKPLRKTLIKDLSDSHLLHIIEHIKFHDNAYCRDILVLMQQEAEYRQKNYIFVPETYE